VADDAQAKSLIEKITALPEEQLSEVEDFVDALGERARTAAMVRAAMTASEPAFAAVWENPEDSAYDAL
jgi:hypothetical protein